MYIIHYIWHSFSLHVQGIWLLWHTHFYKINKLLFPFNSIKLNTFNSTKSPFQSHTYISPFSLLQSFNYFYQFEGYDYNFNGNYRSRVTSLYDRFDIVRANGLLFKQFYSVQNRTMIIIKVYFPSLLDFSSTSFLFSFSLYVCVYYSHYL